MRVFSIFCLILTFSVFFIDAKGLFKFKSETLKGFNGARRFLASGSLRTLIDVINGIASELLGSTNSKKIEIPAFGPAANMHKLKWSAKLEQAAFKYGKNRAAIKFANFKSIKFEQFSGFEWKGLLLEIAETLVELIPVEVITSVLKPVLNILDKFLTALLLMVNYPGSQPMELDKNLGATEALFAHRYEIGCYAKLTYSVCFMDSSVNGGYLYQEGVPCSNCTTHCEFFEDDNGIIEEGDLCEAPTEESNSTSSFTLQKVKLEESSAYASNILSSVVSGVMIMYYQSK